MDRLSKRAPWNKSMTLPIAQSSTSKSRRLPRRRPLLEILFIAFALGLIWYLFSGRQHGPISTEPSPERSRPIANETEELDLLPCSEILGAKDTVVVMKTSAAELEERLPIHFETTLRCYPNSLIFSDWKEKYQGHVIYDAIENIDFKRKAFHPDLDLWRKLRDNGPDILEDEEIWHADQTSAKLDKWKYLLMMNQTLYEYPDKKWYVFLQTDTFIFWNNLLPMLRSYDHRKPWFFASQAEHSPLAQLDAGFAVSHAAVEAIVKGFLADYDNWQERADYHPSGASVLDMTLQEVGIKLSNAWPVLQSRSPGSIDWSEAREDRKLWCYPTISYGNVSPETIREMWKFQQDWLKDEGKGRVLGYTNIFQNYMMPRLTVRSGRVDDWDNFSGDFANGTPADSIDVCRGFCVDKPGCVQFAFQGGKCTLSSVPKMGEYRPGVHSSWLLARAEKWAQDRPGSLSHVCPPAQNMWVVPS